jgi:drug/metabolite transporter (DMT)-like permease
MASIPYFGEISALLTAVCWSGSSIVFAAASARVGSVPVNISRLILALGFLGLLLLVIGIPGSLAPGQLQNLAISGVIGLALGDSFLFRAYRHIGPRVSMLVMSLAPAISAILAFGVLGENLSLFGVSGMGVTLAGVALVVLGREGSAPSTVAAKPAGVLYALVGAVTQGVSLIFAKMAFNEGPINGFLATAIRLSAALIVLFPLVALTGRLPGVVEKFRSDRRALTLTVVGSVLGPFLGISFSLMAVAHTRVGIAATLMATVPIMMLPLVHVLHRESLTWKAITGAMIAVGGVALLFLR